MQSASKLPFRVAAGWAVGTAVTSLTSMAYAVFLLRYLTDFVGLAAAIASFVLATTKIFDIVLSPVIGVMSDRSSSRWGRRRPFMAVGGIIIAIGLIAVFNVPTGLTEAVVAGFAIAALFFVSLGYACFGVPYLAMPAEMTDDANERSRLISYRVYIFGISQIFGGALSPLLVYAFGESRAAYGSMAIALSAVIVLISLLTVFATRGTTTRAVEAESAADFWKSLPSIRKSRMFVCVILIKLTFIIGICIHMVAASFYVRYVLRAGEAFLAPFLIAHSVGMIVSQPLWLRIARGLGRPAGFVLGAIIYGGVSLVWTLCDAATPSWLIVFLSFLNGIGAGGIAMNSEAMLPEAIQRDYEMSDVRREGTLASIYNFVERVGQSIGILIGGLVLAAYNYTPPAPGAWLDPASEQGVIAAFGYVPGFVVAISSVWLLMLGKGPRAGSRQGPLAEETGGMS